MHVFAFWKLQLFVYKNRNNFFPSRNLLSELFQLSVECLLIDRHLLSDSVWPFNQEWATIQLSLHRKVTFILSMNGTWNNLDIFAITSPMKNNCEISFIKCIVYSISTCQLIKVGMGMTRLVLNVDRLRPRFLQNISTWLSLTLQQNVIRFLSISVLLYSLIGKIVN